MARTEDIAYQPVQEQEQKGVVEQSDPLLRDPNYDTHYDAPPSIEPAKFVKAPNPMKRGLASASATAAALGAVLPLFSQEAQASSPAPSKPEQDQNPPSSFVIQKSQTDTVNPLITDITTSNIINSTKTIDTTLWQAGSPSQEEARIMEAAAQSALPSSPTPEAINTYTSLPSDAKETYKGSGIFTAPVSSAMNYDINLRTQNNYGEYGITPESIPGLAIGSIYIKDNAANQFVELAVHERAAYTPFDNLPAPQILSTIIYEGKIQITKDTFIQLPESVKSAFLNLPLAGEGDPSTPKVAQMAELMTSKVDANWTQADQMLDAQGKLSNFDIKSHFSNLTPDQLSQYTLGKTDAQTGHKTPDVITQGLQKMFGDQIVQNAGLPKGPAVWINAKIGGKVTPVLFQQYERVAITVNPNNIDSPTKVTGDMKDAKNKSVVQVGLQGQIVYNGLLAVDARPSATPTAEIPKTPTPKPVEATATPEKSGNRIEIPNKNGTFEIDNQSSMVLTINKDVTAAILDDLNTKRGIGKRNTHLTIKAFGDELETQFKNNEPGVQEVDMGSCKAFIKETSSGSEQMITYQISSNGGANIDSCKRIQDLPNYKPQHAVFSVGMYRDWLAKYGNFDNVASDAARKMLDTLDPKFQVMLDYTLDAQNIKVFQNPPIDSYIP